VAHSIMRCLSVTAGLDVQQHSLLLGSCSGWSLTDAQVKLQECFARQYSRAVNEPYMQVGI
jgi:hypothetical protein